MHAGAEAVAELVENGTVVAAAAAAAAAAVACMLSCNSGPGMTTHQLGVGWQPTGWGLAAIHCSQALVVQRGSHLDGWRAG